jgi:hypothetical protein
MQDAQPTAECRYIDRIKSARWGLSYLGCRRFYEGQFGSDLLRLPTIHLHGLQDPGIEIHRGLLHCCLESNTRLVEWDGNHRMPVTTKDVSAVVAEIQGLTLNLQAADSSGKECCGKY